MPNSISHQDKDKLQAGLRAASLVKDGDVVGLGTGSTAFFAIKALADQVKEGLQIYGVPSSIHTQELAKTLKIPLLEIGEVGAIDISIDGADEFTKELYLIKGGGGALFREKIIASLSKRRIIIADSSKEVEKLGAFKVPIEVVPAAYQYVVNELEKRHGKVSLRVKDNQIFITDNQNFIVDVDFGIIEDPIVLAFDLNQITGILAHGLFINLTTELLMAKGGKVIRYLPIA
jgi:ribose 5-phosphate isomerase A